MEQHKNRSCSFCREYCLNVRGAPGYGARVLPLLSLLSMIYLHFLVHRSWLSFSLILHMSARHYSISVHLYSSVTQRRERERERERVSWIGTSGNTTRILLREGERRQGRIIEKICLIECWIVSMARYSGTLFLSLSLSHVPQ